MYSIFVVALSLFASISASSLPIEKRQIISVSDAPIVPRPSYDSKDMLCIQEVCITADDLKALVALKTSITVNDNGKVGSLALDKMTMGNGKWHLASEDEVFVIRDKFTSNAGKDSRFAMWPGRYVDL